MEYFRLSIIGVIVVASATLAASGCAHSPFGGKLAQSRVRPADSSSTEAPAASSVPPTESSSNPRPADKITVRHRNASELPQQPVEQTARTFAQTARTEPTLHDSPSTTVPAVAANVSPEQLTELDLKELDRALNSPESALPQQYQEYLRTQLMAIAGRGSTALPADRLHFDRTAPQPAPAGPAPLPVGSEKTIPSGVALASHEATVVATPASPSTSAPPLISASAPVTSAVNSTAVPARAASQSEQSKEVQPGQLAAAGSVKTDGVKSATDSTASVDEVRKGEWREHLIQTLDTLEKELARYPSSDRESLQMAASARLLHLVANNRDKAVTALEQLSEDEQDEQEYWKHQLHALLIALDAENKHAGSRRAALTLRELREASDYLANQSTLDVRNLAFCEAVESFGNYTPVKSLSFKPGQPVLLYVELDNFTVHQAGDKYETKFQAEYNIVDASGGRINKKLNPIEETEGRSRRHDYFMSCQLEIPKDLKAGPYTLQLIVEDVIGKKSSEASIDFRVR